MDYKAFFSDFEATFRPLFVEAGNTQFEAMISGDEEKYAKAVELEVKIQELLSDKTKFEESKKINELKLDGDDGRVAYEIYRSYLSHQADPALMKQISELDSEINQEYSTFRAKVDGKQYSDNELIDVLDNSTDRVEIEKVWLESKKVGSCVAARVVKLAKLRNRLAVSLGYANYREMSLDLQDFEPIKLDGLFDELDEMTSDSFAKAKDFIDEKLARKYSIDQKDLGPWAYGRYFQDAPKIFDLDLDKIYLDQDLVALTKKHFESIGLNIDSIMKTSDLYEKPGKNQHASCWGIDVPDVVRVLCNVKPNNQWMDTMLHEFGHGVYDKFILRELPWVLRGAAHTFTTEAVAIFFGALSSDPAWIAEVVRKDLTASEAKDAAESLRMERLAFSRFVQVMYRFEKGLYENPDQDLDRLWWDLVAKYQLLKRPAGERAGDWAAKIHIATAPIYYHNYILGHLLAAQLKHYLLANVTKKDNFTGDSKIGQYFKEKFFSSGQRYLWPEFVKLTVGEELTPKYFAKEVN